ncbi:MAG: cytochrome c oxidase subunit 3 [Cytophagales bacterium]|nr:cytochrome c oxidase subunit 3 [Cytophagales bacterium]
MTIEYRQTKQLMQLFIASESLFFAALIIAFVYFQNLTDNWPVLSRDLEVGRTAVFSVFLFSSSFTLDLAGKSFRKGNKNGALFFLLLTILLGSIFLVGQLTEYYALFQKEVRVNSDIFGSAFFTLTGFHGFHVLVGLLILSVYFILLRHNRLDFVRQSPPLLAFEWYWHFVDFVWVFVFSIVYLKPLL